MSVKDKVDIIIVNDNGNGAIQTCIDCIKKNTDGYKLIIVDAASYDGSKEWLIENSVSPHIILNKRRVNVARARNQAISVGNAEWVAFITPQMLVDDRLWLDKVWNYTIDRDIGLIEVGVNYGKEWGFSALDLCMVRRKTLNEVGWFDERIYDGQDTDWLIRLEWSKWRTAYCYDVDATSKTPFDRKEVFGNELIDAKYNQAFIQKTLRENSDRRKTKEIQLHNQEK